MARNMKTTEAERMLLNAKTAKQTKKALEAGANVNVVCPLDGTTALILARTAQQTKLLIKEGANVNAIDDKFCTALMYAKTAKQTRLLIEAGADVNAEDYCYTGHRPLMLAETAEQTRLLIKAGANVNERDFNGYTALMYAKTAEQTRLLIKAGANVNERAPDGTTPLMSAKNAQQTKLLIDAGAYVKERYERNNKGGFTALMYATTAEQTRLLIKAGANVNQTDCWGHSVLEHARTAEQARLLIKAGAKGKISPFLLRIESEQRESLKKRLKNEIANNEKTKLSGVVVANTIAKMKIDGKIQGDITPKMGEMIRAKIMADKETKTEKHEETKKSEINALRSLEAFMEVANQHRPYEPWDFKKESYIPDLMLALLIATNLAIGTPSGKLPARLDTKNKTEERALTKLYQNMQNNKAIMFDSSKVL